MYDSDGDLAVSYTSADEIKKAYPPRDHSISSLISECAAKQGDLDTLQWLRAQTPPSLWGKSVRAATKKGQLHILQWIHTQNPSLFDTTVDFSCMDTAARYGHLHIMQWLRSLDPPHPMNISTCYAAVIGNSLKSLKWLRSQSPPCPWNKWVCKYAAAHGHLYIMEWAFFNGCPFDVDELKYFLRQRTMKQYYDTQCWLNKKNITNDAITDWMKTIDQEIHLLDLPLVLNQLIKYYI